MWTGEITKCPIYFVKFYSNEIKNCNPLLKSVFFVASLYIVVIIIFVMYDYFIKWTP